MVYRWGRRVAPWVRRGYRGPDRRGLTLDLGAPAVGWPASLAIATILAVGAVTTVLALGPAATALSGTTALRGAILGVACVLLALLWTWSRASGLVRPLRLGTCAWLLALATAVSSIPAARSAVLVVAASWAVRAFGGPEVDTTARPATDGVIATATAAAAVAAVTWVPGAERLAAAAAVGAWAVALVATAREASPLPGAAWAPPPLVVAVASAVTVHAVAPLPEVAADVVLLAGLAVACAGALRCATAGTRRAAPSADPTPVVAALDRHELRNALLAVDGATTVLGLGAGGMASVAHDRAIRDVRSSIEHLRALVEDGPVPSARPPVRPRRVPSRPGRRAAVPSVDLVEPHREPLAAEVAAICRERAAVIRARGIRVTVSGRIPAVGAIAPTALRQVVDNLLRNAERHGDARRGGVHLTVRPRGREVVIDVRDHGPGVPWRRRPAVCAAGHRRGAGAGSGLGLHQVARAVAEHGGRLSLHDAPGGGLIARVRLPVAARASDRALVA